MRRLILARIEFVMLNFSFEFHTVLWVFNKQKFLILMFLDLRMHARCLCFPLEKKMLELNLSARDTACFNAMQVCLDHCIVMDRFDASPKR